MTNSKVSIIIPAYNTADVIRRTLKSLENQIYSNYEIVIINDGSTDGTKNLLDEYKKNKNNIIVYHQENQGVSSARNKGIELSTGKFVCFLDSDDTYEPEFLALTLEKQQQNNANVVYCMYTRCGQDGSIKKMNNEPVEGNILKHFFTENGYFHLSTMLIKKDFLTKNNIYFKVGRKISEDVMFTVRLMLKTHFYCINHYLFNYHYRNNSVINSKWNEELYISNIYGYQLIIDNIASDYQHDDK